MATPGDGGGPSVHDAAADAIWNAEFLIIVGGPNFTEDYSRAPFNSDFCDVAVAATPNKFMGFWGKFYNDYVDRQPHEGFQVLSRWREKYFDVRSDDQRKRQPRKKGDEDAANPASFVSRCVAVTTACDNLFQKCGFPQEDVNDMWGNVTQWQCSRVPPCCQKVWTVDRQFRFMIDSSTHEAAPIKYETDKRDTRLVLTWQQVDSDDEKEEGYIPNTVKGPRNLPWLDRATVIRHTRHSQFNPDAYGDLFTGFVMNVAAELQTKSFDIPPEEIDDAASMMYHSNASISANPEKPDEAPNYGPSCPPPPRCSHLCAHVDALDNRVCAYQEGTFRLYDAEWLTKDRRNYNHTVTKYFDANVPHIAYKRQKYIWYNISIVIVDDSVKDRLLMDNSAGFRSSVMEKERVEYLRSGQCVEPVYAIDPALWTQGMYGHYYFSHVKSTSTVKEPHNQREIDIVSIPLPKQFDLILPAKGRVSVVCETVVWESERLKTDADKAKGAPPPPPNDGSANPYSYTSNVWQIVGHINAIPPEKYNTIEGEGATLEYLLMTRKCHSVRFGTNRKGTNGRVTYISLEIPCDERDSFAAPLIMGSLSVKEDPIAEADAAASAAIMRLKEEKSRPPRPVPNHQMCLQCHDIARPHVLMARPGKRDDGICATVVAAKQKAFKTWEKLMLDAIKADSSRAIVILEMGCDKRMEPCRSYSEKLFKQVKQVKSTFIRIAPQNIETKGGGKGGEKEANNIVIEDNVIHALHKIDGIISEKQRKLARGV